MSSANSTRRRKQPDQPSHNWTPREDVAPVEALTEICVGGYWKVDNGFRSGYLGKLEQIIEQKLPNCGLKANPHIESRLKTLKKQTLAIYDMLSNSSGFSWNHEEKMVVCEKQVFDDWVKVHKDAKGLRMKPFIHYDSLIEAFGRDRANGLGAEGPAEADEDLNNENNYADIEENGLDEITVPSSVTRNSANPPSARTRKRARDADSQCLGDMASTLRSFVDVTKAHLETMQGVLMNEHVTSERRGKLVEELMKIEGINDYDVIEAAAAIIGDDSKIDLLFSLPDNLKSQWIHKLLGH
ncbi:uncharacterized protein LOC133737011 [Rosa rugosa]|uniref:uncharacterized protein LOC133737011 n=1 Tax=Rosa rugosa TaxID=74645 RepID=UPI002B4065F1|nr:uncharacterized protein LOC133737011 [Rosa rugosa]